MLVYMCACRLRLCVRSGLRLRLTHHLSRPPPHHHALPVEDAAGALVISRAGAGCSGERRPTLGGRLAGPGPTGLAGPRLGVGGLWVSGPRARSALVGRLPVEPAGLPPRHPGAPTLWLSEVPPSGSPLPFLGGGRGCPCGGSPGGPVPWGAWMFGARVFSVPASCLAGWGCCSPHTLLKFTWRNLMNTSALTHTGVHSSIHIGVKTGAHRHHCLDLLLLQNLFCNISYVCSII